MTGDNIRQILKHEPFMPFTLGLMGKTRVRVTRPDWAIVSPGGETLVVFDANREFHMISVAHIASVTFQPPPEPDAVVSG